MKIQLGRVFFLSISLSLVCLTLAACSAFSPTGNVPSPGDNKGIALEPVIPTSFPDIRSFAGQPKHIQPGDTTTLSWKVTGAELISIEPGTGKVDGESGSIVVTPLGTTLYTLTAAKGDLQIQSKFLVIMQTPDGNVIWPGDNFTAAAPVYEGWIYYPNKYIDWIITDKRGDPTGDTFMCWNLGYITNNNPDYMMTDITMNKILLPYNILPGLKQGYTVSFDCLAFPDMKWKWKKFP